MRLSLYLVVFVTVLLTLDKSTASEAVWSDLNCKRGWADLDGRIVPGEGRPDPARRPIRAVPQMSAMKAAYPSKVQMRHIAWESDQQKTICTEYMEEILVHFLKGRHLSIHGKCPCEAASHALAFVEVSGKIKGACPEGMLEGFGYTDRIQRNFDFLQALGTDRCKETLRASSTHNQTCPYRPE